MDRFDAYLHSLFQDDIPSTVLEAMQYSLFAGGKRVRPQLLLLALEGYGIDPKLGYPMAAAIEMIHTYSLIHDDLPAMDDDDLRRGKPTCHKQFSEASAILAGDGLLTKAFYTASLSKEDPSIQVELIQALSQYAGCDGMIYGQCLDIQEESDPDPTLEKLIEVDLYKTGKLITLPLVAAALIAHHPEDRKIMNELGEAIGIQFQIQDDILDATSNEESMGKSLSDAENEKATVVSLLTLEKAKELEATYTKSIHELLSKLHGEFGALKKLIAALETRTH